MQTVHNLAPAVGAPGMLFDDKEGNDIVSCIAGEDLQPGRWVELASSDVKTGPATVQLMQQTTSTCAPYGVVVRDQQREANNWPDNSSQGIKSGTRVAVLRRGRIFVERDSADTASVARFDTPKIMHSSTNSAKRGMMTQAAASTAAGAEVTAQTVCQVWQDCGTSGLLVMEVFVK